MSLFANKISRRLIAVCILLLVLLLPIQDVFSQPVMQTTPFLNLEGEWEFYWQQWLDPKTFHAQDATMTTIEVPSSWRGYFWKGKHLDSSGFATYRLQTTIPSAWIGKEQALFFRYISSAYRLWINGEEYQGTGTVGLAEREIPYARANTVYFTPTKTSLEILVHVSNYSYIEGGITNEVLLGNREQIDGYVYRSYYLKPMLLLGTFIALGLYHVIIFMVRRDDYALLWFGLLSSCSALYILFLNEHLISPLFPSLEWVAILKILYLIIALIMFFFTKLSQSLYPQDIHQWTTKGIGFTIFGLYLSTVWLPINQFLVFQYYINFLNILIVFYLSFFLGIRLIKNKRPYAYLYMTSLIIFFIGIVNDTLYYTQLPSLMPIVDLTFAAFIFIQGIIISLKFAQVYQENKDYSRELLIMNSQLEEKVKERTLRLIEKNEELEERDQIRVHTMTNITHDILSPLVGVQAAMLLLEKEEITETQKAHIIEKAIERIGDIQGFISQLIELIKLETHSVSFSMEVVTIQHWFETVKRKYNLELELKNIALIATEKQDIPMGTLRIDQLQLIRVMQNLIDNAVKFNRNNAPIMIRLQLISDDVQEGSFLLVEVIDRGIGMDEEQVKLVFERYYSRRIGSADGKGLGLAIVKEIVHQHRGNYGVKSKLGQGSTFYFTLPIYENEINREVTN